MNSLIVQNALQAAALLIQSAVGAAGQRLLEQLAPPATELCKRLPRMDVSRAQLDWQLNIGGYNLQFSQALRDAVQTEASPNRSGSRSLASTTFEALSLVDDHSEDERVTAHRLSAEMEQDCEWELRELDSLVGALLGFGRPDHERNPLRPEVIGRALFRAMAVGSRDESIRRLLLRELGRVLSPLMRPCYRAIIDDLKARGIEPVDLALRTVEGPGNDLVRDAQRTGSGGSGGSGSTSGYETSVRDTGQALNALSSIFGIALPRSGGEDPRATGHRTLSGGGVAGGGMPLAGGLTGQGGFGNATGHGAGMGGGGYGPAGVGAASGASEAQVVDVIRRLAALGALTGEAGLGGLPTGSSSRGTLGYGTGGGGSGGPGGAMGLSMPGTLGMGGGHSAGGADLSGLMAVNLIRAHREELMRASSGALDQMVIDVVATMFDQILSDTKVAPQMARQIARLQMPVLRAALKDVGFFSSRKHPVRRFVNRIATLAAAYEDFDEGQGKQFLERVRDLVQQIVEGDFDQMELYDSKLQALESLVAELAGKDTGPHAAAAQLLDDRETELRIQQRYMRELQQRLLGLPAPEFLRDFLAQVWSQVVVMVNGPKGSPALAKRLEHVASDLVLSILPKGEPSLRKGFLLKLPQLMKDLNEGLTLIRWPDEARKSFLAQLLPTHADSLKQAPPTPSVLQALEQQLQALAAVPIPKPQDLATLPSSPGDLPPPEAHAAPLAFSPEEAAEVGLVEESAVDWNGEVDIDLGVPGAPGSTEVDIVLDGSLAEGSPPTHGVALMEYLQPGIAYRMHLNGSWQRVRLSWTSPGRAFFVFTHGKSNQKTISMTARMLSRMCETERFRAYEQAELIERATIRARRQLAQLGAPTTR